MFLRMTLATILLLVALIGASPSAARTDPVVLALYYPWYNAETWSDPVLSDVPAEPYVDPATIRRQVSQARAAGIDVLVSAWFGPTDENPTETGFRTLLDEAQRQGLRAALLLETDNDSFFPSRDALRDALSYALSIHGPHPAYFKESGFPAIFVWRPRSIWSGDQRIGRDGPASVDAWRTLRAEVDPNQETVWVAETESTAYLEAFDGMFFYNVAGVRDKSGLMNRVGSNVQAIEERTGEEKLWVGTAMPGYDDTRLIDRGDRFAVDRENGSFYESTFRAAAGSNPDWILIVSFNEWVEGHQIEPSVSYGDLYLDLTQSFTEGWKAEVAGAQHGP